jgi:high-affinity nickel-transport protein
LAALGLVGGVLRQRAGGWAAIAALNGDFNQLGFAIIVLFAAARALSFLIYRLKKLDSFEPPPRS